MSDLPSPSTPTALWPKQRVLAAIVVVVVVGWLLIATSPEPRGPPNFLGQLWIGLIFGTLFGQVSLAAAWCALGPFALAWRMILSAGWLAAIVISLLCLLCRDAPTDGPLAVLLIFGGAMLAQWLLVQAPFWLLVAKYGASIRHGDDEEVQRDMREHQVGIRQLMILTLIVGLVLGIGRLALGGIKWDSSSNDWKGMLSVFFLAFCQAIMALPLVGAALHRTTPVIAMLIALLLVGFATFLETSLMNLIEQQTGPRSDELIFWFLSFTQAAWIIGVGVLMRVGGYRLSWRTSR